MRSFFVTILINTTYENLYIEFNGNISSFFNATSQIKIIDSTLYVEGKFIFKNHPEKKQGIICEFYTNTNVLKYKYEFITKLKKFDAKKFHSYKNNNEFIIDGKYVEFFDNGDTLKITKFKNGIIERHLHYNKYKTLESELLIITPKERLFSLYYPNGIKKMQFRLVNNEKDGEETHFFDNGNIKLRIQNKNNQHDGELTEYYLDSKIKRMDKYENNTLISKACFDIEGDSCVYTSLIDTFKLIDQQNQLFALRSNPKIKEYLKRHSISFSCLLANDNRLSSIERGSSPDSIFEIIYDWATKRVSWKSEKYSDTPVIVKLNFHITSNTSNYFVLRRPYNANINNHAYLPIYEIMAYDREMDEAPYVMVDDMPQFNGKNPDNARLYVAKNLKYPEEAAKLGIQGRVYLQFIVAKDGSIKEVSILRGVHPLLDNEAIRVIKSMPKWRPGYHKGKPVNVQFTFPVNFVVQGGKKRS